MNDNIIWSTPLPHDTAGSYMGVGDELLDASGKYIYMTELRGLDALRSPVTCVPEEIAVVDTPLNLEAWKVELRDHPDKEYVQYLLDGISGGFRIGFDYSSHACTSSPRNIKSASEHPEPIDRYIREEVAAGRIIGPLAEDLKCQIQISRFGVIPKPHQAGKWRLITDLSSPTGRSVNDGVDSLLCSLSYASVDDAVERIRRLGPGTALSKFDIANAYRIVPVHSADRMLLGMMWKGKLYVDGALPFGLRSAPKIFTAVADGLLWIMGRHGITNALHYLDDFLLLGSSSQCEAALQTSLSICRTLGIPIANHKVEGPATVLPFLGILIDTDNCILSLPPEKLQRLKGLIKSWQGRKCCKKRELLSLIGQLSHASRVIRSGRTFLRRMIDLASVPKELHHWVRLNKGFQSDLHWWSVFLDDWNGTSMFSGLVRTPPVATITSDASGSWGCGAFISSGAWFQFCWPPSWGPIHITMKELLPIVVACAVWGHQWKGKTVLCRCDNAAVVAIIKSGSSKNQVAMHLMRCLFFFSAFHQLLLVPQHVPGKDNTAADHLSRDAVSSFLQLVPAANPLPTKLPEALMLALVHQRPDWTSPVWRDAFHSILNRESPPQPKKHTSLEKIAT